MKTYHGARIKRKAWKYDWPKIWIWVIILAVDFAIDAVIIWAIWPLLVIWWNFVSTSLNL